ncbi:hypothetical protein EB796_016010 [Bugula neritina]|uniref:DUF4587 domain-containing protein n=1 Tax=Bugula neritina TaxID=10212 RepID=A0A7J7JHE2_BUGNE|nr:hypothetical protein EB796_016010 [Bugula neritina]
MASMQTNRHDDINEQMTKLQMKLLEQRLDNARKDNPQKELGQGQTRTLDPQKIRYHQEVLKRQELLERIKNTTTQYEDRRSPGRENYINPAISPSPRQNIQPIQTQPIVQPAIVQPVIYQQQPQVLGGVPLIAPTQPPQQGNKSEFYDMLMLQNAQMHQLFMQQMLTQGLQTPKHEPQTLVIEQASQPQPFIPPQPQYITLPNTKRRKSKHYHHYNQLPPIHAEDRPLQVNHIHHTEPRRSTPPVNIARPVTRVESPDYNQVRPRPRPAPTSLPPGKFRVVCHLTSSLRYSIKLYKF